MRAVEPNASEPRPERRIGTDRRTHGDRRGAWTAEALREFTDHYLPPRFRHLLRPLMVKGRDKEGEMGGPYPD